MKPRPFSSEEHRSYSEPLSQGGTDVWHCVGCGCLVNGKDELCGACLEAREKNITQEREPWI